MLQSTQVTVPALNSHIHTCGYMNTYECMCVDVCAHLYTIHTCIHMSMYMDAGQFTCVSTMHTTSWVDLECSHQQSVNCGKIIPNNGEAKKKSLWLCNKVLLGIWGFWQYIYLSRFSSG